MKLSHFATARSGDKGRDANIGVVALDEKAYLFLKEQLTEEKLMHFFAPLCPSKVVRFDLDQLFAFNFVLYDILAPGGSLSLRCDAQGKALGVALMEMDLG